MQKKKHTTKKMCTLFFSTSSQAPVDGELVDEVVSLGPLVEKTHHRLTAAEIIFSSAESSLKVAF